MAHQKFKGKEYTQRKVVNNIIRYMELATDQEVQGGINWYADAKKLAQEYSDKTGIPLRNVAGVISALSPQTSWELNKVYLVRFLRDGIDALANTTANKIKAQKCLNATSVDEIVKVLNGNKTVSFFLNILFPDTDGVATIDRHAVAICIQRPDKVKPLDAVQLTNIQYSFFENAYIEVAKKYGLKACEVQAITWVTYRRLRGLK